MNLILKTFINYDTRIIHNNLSFPLLKELFLAGDPLAKKVFKEEIAKRLTSSFPNTTLYLIEQEYFIFLEDDELSVLIDNIKVDSVKEVIIDYLNIPEKDKSSKLLVRRLYKGHRNNMLF